MSVKIENYNDQFHRSGVLACLKRNYKWMNSLNDEELYEWVKPFLNYDWKYANIKDIPCKHGHVILNDNSVVGYLGYIYSSRVTMDEKYNYMTATTWAIDDGFRIYMFKAFKIALSYSQVSADFTARKSVEEMLLKIFKFHSYNNLICKFLPLPYIGKNNIQLTIIKSQDILNINIRKEYEDHISYGIRCARVLDKNKNELYIFYKIIWKKLKI